MRLRPMKSAAKPDPTSDSPNTAPNTVPTMPSCAFVTPRDAKSALICGSAELYTWRDACSRKNVTNRNASSHHL